MEIQVNQIDGKLPAKDGMVDSNKKVLIFLLDEILSKTVLFYVVVVKIPR